VDTIDKASIDKASKDSKPIDGTKKLPDKRFEETARLHAQGQKLHFAWIKTSPIKIELSSGYQGAYKLRRDLAFMARVEYFRSQSMQKADNTAVMSERSDNPLETVDDFRRHYYHLATTARDAEALRATKELASMLGIDKQIVDLNSRPDPAQLLGYLARCRIMRKEPIVEACDGNMDRVAKVIAEVCGLDSVEVEYQCKQGVYSSVDGGNTIAETAAWLDQEVADA